jgi:hypothetical protein
MDSASGITLSSKKILSNRTRKNIIEQFVNGLNFLHWKEESLKGEKHSDLSACSFNHHEFGKRGSSHCHTKKDLKV